MGDTPAVTQSARERWEERADWPLTVAAVLFLRALRDEVRLARE